MPLDATGVLDEADLRGEETEVTAEVDAGWEDVIDGAPATAEAAPDQELEGLTSAPGDAADALPVFQPAERAEADSDFIERIQRAREVVRTTAAALEVARERAKAAKQSWESAVLKLTDTIDEGPERYPLFEQQDDVSPNMPAAETEVEPPIPQPAEPPAEAPRIDLAGPVDADDWRATTLVEIGVPKGICQILAANPDHPIITRGELVEWIDYAGIDDEPLLQIPKIGAGKRDKIIEAILKYDANDNGET